jgi:hypothetical protein
MEEIDRHRSLILQENLDSSRLNRGQSSTLNVERVGLGEGSRGTSTTLCICDDPSSAPSTLHSSAICMQWPLHGRFYFVLYEELL